MLVEWKLPVHDPGGDLPRFSVRGLIVLVLVVGFVLGWFVRRAHLQSEAVAAVRNAGGTVAYDWEDNEWHPVQGGKPGGPKWLADRLGPDYFDTVIAVLDGHTMSDAEMPLIGELDRLEVLDINDASAVSDLGLSPVTALKRLRKLSIRGTRATDAGLEHIKNLTKLEELDLDNTEVSGAGLKFLQKLTRLLILSLSGTDVDDAGLEHLKGLTNLEALRLGQTKITGAGLVHVAALTNLRSLDLMETPVDDAGLAHIQRLTNMRFLNLRSTDVTDAGLAHLREMPDLSILWLEDTKVTDLGLAHLKYMKSLNSLWLGAKTTDPELASLMSVWFPDPKSRNASRPADARTPCTITDAGLAQLEGLTALLWLWLDNTMIGDEGLTHLKRLSGLRGLSLVRTKVTDGGLAELSGLRLLLSLHLSGNELTDAGMSHLKQLTGLSRLGLDYTNVGDAGPRSSQG